LSGEYNSILKIAFNPKNNLITGFFEDYTGYDESGGNAKFSCIFYLKGTYNGHSCEIETYYPINIDSDKIIGTLKIFDSKRLSIKLDKEHGGCWNVFHFADDFVDFELSKKTDWLEIRYIDIDKSYFYKDKNEESKQKAYLIKGDIVYIDNIENDWVHCIFNGKSTSEGWIKKETINQ